MRDGRIADCVISARRETAHGALRDGQLRDAARQASVRGESHTKRKREKNETHKTAPRREREREREREEESPATHSLVGGPPLDDSLCPEGGVKGERRAARVAAREHAPRASPPRGRRATPAASQRLKRGPNSVVSKASRIHPSHTLYKRKASQGAPVCVSGLVRE